jgi:hypothetical protein
VLEKLHGGVIILKGDQTEIQFINDQAKFLLLIPQECDELKVRIADS